MLLHVTHETRYEYAPPVETAQHLAHLKPLATGSQRLVSHTLAIDPPPAQRGELPDVYGNTRAFFALEATHDRLVVTAESVVETSVPVLSDAIARDLPWETVRERFRFRKDATFDAASEFVFPSPYVPRHDDFAAYARASFAPGRPTFDAAMDLTERMYRDFDYDADSTEINTPAVEALAQRKGVCQDFAHIMIACFRTLGLPARYVSGYLLTQPPPGQPRLVGADASHAWVSVYLPGEDDGPGGWADFDPTNGRQPGEDYVTLAIGRDYSDVSPMRGVLHGGARHTLSVGVTVQPVGEVIEGLPRTQTQSPSQDKESP
ncbi:transglutaminase-like putative cysteine protease [Variovorax boronicumulans]|uniref:transglutaminase family protein n=1 Tax=Variovorax boronicumulans TaxID=436515 RepID=UPI0024750E4A|nr:transglutaminase family protein [Variovorax boronicumulans]MDH6168274.1 transglutaminase-like putative cysteine protease [Variovorax boronicumulans]